MGFRSYDSDTRGLILLPEGKLVPTRNRGDFGLTSHASEIEIQTEKLNVRVFFFFLSRDILRGIKSMCAAIVICHLYLNIRE